MFAWHRALRPAAPAPRGDPPHYWGIAVFRPRDDLAQSPLACGERFLIVLDRPGARGGMSFTAVLQNFRVSRLWLGLDTSAPAFLHLKKVATNFHVPIEQERRGQSFSWDDVQIDFLWPEPLANEISATAKNNDSLVVRLRYGDRTILLPGDAEKQVAYAMLAENDPGFLHADVLKFGHHGNKNSTMPQFLDAVNPRISVISAGEENPYGHPHPELLERLQEKGTRILRTDRDGAVQILTDGHSLRVSCFRACPLVATESVSTQITDQSQGNQQ
jgi:competence protein ComEC